MSGTLEFLIVLAILSALVVYVTAPLRRVGGPAGEAFDQLDGPELAELEAAREAKYRELRDAELDHRTGKLSDADYEELERSLRGEAIEILRGLDRVRAQSRLAD
jgi:hypothetical protein